MNIIGTFITSILGAISARTFAKATPYLEAELKALLALAEATLSVVFDGSLSAEEKHQLYHDAVNGLKTVVASAEQEGGEIASDTLNILTGALGDQLLGAFGIGK